MDLPDAEYPDGQTAEAAVAALTEMAGRSEPFLLAVGFRSPHLPFAAPKRYSDLYDEETIPLAPNRYRPEGSPPIAFDRYNLRQYLWEHADPDRLFSDDYARTLRHAYFACVSFVDAQVGTVLRELDRLDLRKNTIVVFTADHGLHLGEQNHWGKTTLHEASLHVPLIISWGARTHGGRSTDALVESVDVMPTLIDLAGFEVPSHLEGTSLKPVMERPDRPWKHAAFSNQPRGWLGEQRGYSIRTERYRYMEWKDTATGAVVAGNCMTLIATREKRSIVPHKVTRRTW